MKEVFQEVYQKNQWGGGSGVGSLPESTTSYRALLEDVLKKYQVRSVLDIGCGDWQVGSLVNWGDIDYRGVDIVPDVIAAVRERYEKPGRSFSCGNVQEMDLPPADLLIIKDVMQHWLPEEILRFLPVIERYPLALITNDIEDPDPGKKIPWHSRWHPVDLSLPPFNKKGETLLTYSIRPVDPPKKVVLFRKPGTEIPTPKPAPQTKSGQGHVLDLIKMLRPWSMRSHQKVRIGTDHDGGYVLPDSISNCDAVVSIGVGSDVSFDLELANRGVHVFQYDHTVPRPPQTHPNFRFHRLGWGPATSGSFVSFADIHAAVKKEGSLHPMLKFDVEGAEYDLLESTDPALLADFEIIACELHHFERLNDPKFFSKVSAAFEKLNRGHVPVHLHANNYSNFVVVEGIPIPGVLEVTFLRRDLDNFPSFSNDPIPGPLDRPNKPGKPDLCMNPF